MKVAMPVLMSNYEINDIVTENEKTQKNIAICVFDMESKLSKDYSQTEKR